MEKKMEINMGISDAIETVKETETIKQADKTTALVVRAVHAAMNSQTTKDVHPTYVEIIKQMSPYNAIVFKKLLEVLVQKSLACRMTPITAGSIQ